MTPIQKLLSRLESLRRLSPDGVEVSGPELDQILAIAEECEAGRKWVDQGCWADSKEWIAWSQARRKTDLLMKEQH